MSEKQCPYCSRPLELVTGARLYPDRTDLHHKPFWACFPCEAWVGCHPGTTKRLGRVAKADTRALKRAAHSAFDKLWTSGHMTRSAAYRWLGQQLGLDKRDCHIGWMDDAQLRETVRLSHQRFHHLERI
jgi:hypothetical protein